jgi:nucleoside-diphosphate-sugar epimerase
LRQTHAAGIRRFIYTGSIIAAWNAKMTMTDQGTFSLSHLCQCALDSTSPTLAIDWYTIPPGASVNDRGVSYAVGKTEGEKAIWAYGDEHPEMDITVCEYPPNPHRRFLSHEIS